MKSGLRPIWKGLNLTVFVQKIHSFVKNLYVELFKAGKECGKNLLLKMKLGDTEMFSKNASPGTTLTFYSAIAYLLRRVKHHAQRGVDEARSDGSAARHCNNIRPRNSRGAITQRADQEPGCSQPGSSPSGSV